MRGIGRTVFGPPPSIPKCACSQILQKHFRPRQFEIVGSNPKVQEKLMNYEIEREETSCITVCITILMRGQLGVNR